jgi:hypothetical protein
MSKLPFSDKYIEHLKATPYVKPAPLTIPALLILIIFFPIGLYYLVQKQTPEYMLNRCKTDQEREALFDYLKTSPDVCDIQPENSFLNQRYFFNQRYLFKQRYIFGTQMYKRTRGIRH